MLLYDSISNPGEREHNEDSVGVQKKGEAYCFVLADGLGGHGGGDEASRLVVRHIVEDFAKNGEVSEAYLRRCFDEGQKALLKQQKEYGRTMEMKTTLTVLLAKNDYVQWGHIGDSRIYYFQDNKFIRRTLDHSVPQMLVLAGRLKEKDIRGHIDRNRLLRVMGAEWDTPQYQIGDPLQCKGGETFLLCSDGFWEWIQEKSMRRLLKRTDSPSKWLEAMEKIVIKNGKGKHMDNYSALAVFL